MKKLLIIAAILMSGVVGFADGAPNSKNIKIVKDINDEIDGIHPIKAIKKEIPVRFQTKDWLNSGCARLP